MPQLSEQQFNQILQKVTASAPDGLDESAFNSLLDREVAQAESGGMQTPGDWAPVSTGGGRGGSFSPANQRRNLISTAENAPMIGGSIGALVGGVPGAAVGGAGGALVRDLRRASVGDARTPRTGAEAAENVGLHAAGQAALSKGGGLVGRGIVRSGQWIASKADPLIQSAVKPALSELRLIAGRTGSSMAGEAKRISGIIRRTGIRTPEAAEAGIKAAEQRVQDALASVGPEAENVTILTDAPARAGRYLDKLGRSASRQMSPADDMATVASERAQFERTSPMFQTVETQVAKEVPSAILDDAGRPMMRTSHETVASRVPRANVTAGESMELARGTSRHATRKAYGEQKGMSVEAQKALERAGRDAAKAAAPESMRADLQTQGELIRLKPILDRMMVRSQNRDAMSLPGLVAAAPALAQGKIPVLGMAAQWMRNNQLRAGLRADKIGHAMSTHGSDAGASSEMLARALIALLSPENPTGPPE